MIVQIVMARNEHVLIKELLPVWKKYADGFVFLLDRCTDSSLEYLQEVKDQYNILEILFKGHAENDLIIETDIRQRLFDAAYKYSSKIICLDADEYLDGPMTKQELHDLLDQNKDTVLHLQWMQYTSCNTVRVDGPWRTNFKDRIGNYSQPSKFETKQNHSTHLPFSKANIGVDPSRLFIAHLQWLDKLYVAIKQYYWKVMDYANNKQFGVEIVGSKAYDESVNNFEWEEEYTLYPLKISQHVIIKMAVKNNYRLEYIREMTKKLSIPNLGDWGFNILGLTEAKIADQNPYKISVITAIGNLAVYEKFIPRYLENVKEQHFFKETEHVIVYSEWSDLFNEFTKYPNFILIQEDRKAGMYHAWNLGIKAATTKYVTNWNVDDLRHPINTKIKYDLLEANDYDVAYNYYAASRDIEETFHNLDLKTKQILMFPDEYEKYALEACLIGPDPMWKKELHEKVGYFDLEDFSTIGDWEMWIRFAKADAKFKLIPEVLCIYLDHDETVSKVQMDKAENQKLKLIQKYKK
jgi:hypothetical protein